MRHASGRRWGWLLIGAVCLAAACGGGKGTPMNGGAGGLGGIGIGGSGGADAGLTACLDVPGSLDRPPSGRLPCELIPPGLRL